MANSPKYHPLTDRIMWTKQNGEYFDRAIRSYLEACAEKLTRTSILFSKTNWKYSVREILGLGDVETLSFCKACNARPCDCPDMEAKERTYCSYPCSHFPETPPKETPKQKWCEHCVWYSGNWAFNSNGHYLFTGLNNWDICPVKGCHAPRPVTLTTQERLAQYLYEECVARIETTNFFDAERPVQAHYMDLSGKVIKWLEDHK